MAYLTEQTEQGNGIMHKIKDGIFECTPNIPERIKKTGKTNTWHMWHMKAVGKMGERIKIRIEWPLYDPNSVPDEIKNMPNYDAEWESFVTAARDVVFMSSDRINWTRIDNVRLCGNSLYFETDLQSEEMYFTVTLYYTPCNYKNLIEYAAGSDLCRITNIGTDMGGDDIYAFCVTDFSVPEEGKRCVYLQGAQHCSEFNGAHLCDFMIRYLCSGDADPKILKKYIFRFVPIASMTSLRKGMDVHESGINPNRDWVNRELPSTRAIHNYLQGLNVKPSLLLDIHSGLANYGSWDICQALSVNDNLPEPELGNMKRFFDIVYENCDFLPVAKKYWISFVDKSMFDGYGEQYGQTHTMEISHYALYDRKAGKHFPIEQSGISRFAKQLAGAINIFLEEIKDGRKNM